MGTAMAYGLALSTANAAVTQDNFPPKTTADLVALCTAQQQDPLAAAALNFCQGFAEGAVEIALSYSAAGTQSHRPFCLPAPAPTLDQAASDFASWAGSDPSRLQKPAVVGLMTYLIDRYPCPHETPHHSHG
nr:Rap1a/Tai family immunity protein [uncultured Rhodopila sp.]